MRTTVVAGNWKMNLDRAGAAQLAAAVREVPVAGCELGVAPPFPYLQAVAESLAGSPIWVAGQDCSAEDSGAHTGDVSAVMLKDVGCSHVILGHSERRHGHGEAADEVGRKIAAALRSGLVPVVCVGETLEERQAERTQEVVIAQARAALSPFSVSDLEGCILAYEPVWAIGTGLNATAEQAGEVHRILREWLSAQFGSAFAEATRIQYGGSVKPDNAAELLAVPDVDGALVGGASLKADSFLGIAQAAPRG